MKHAEKSNVAVAEGDVSVEIIDASSHAQYMNHETVYKITSPRHDVTALVGVHNTVLGPGLGGVRHKYYESEDEALGDVLRLSEAMTWKNAAAGLDHGGGKTVLIHSGNKGVPDETAYQVLAHGLNKINAGKAVYYGAEDMNFGEPAVNYIHELTQWVKGATSDDPSVVGGDPSPLTAMGVFECIKVAVRHKMDRDNLEGMRISIQGLGNVGGSLAVLLHEAGAFLTGTDTDQIVFENLQKQGVEIKQAGLDEIYDVPADIFSPNAIGGTLSDRNIERLKNAGVQIVCGGANNQQEDQIGNSQSRLMKQNGMLYCPDYIVNCGGVIWVAMVGENAEEVRAGIKNGTRERFEEVVKIQEQNPDKHMAEIAAAYARRRIEEKSSN